MNELIQTMNQSKPIAKALEDILNDSPERNNLNGEAVELAKILASMPNLPEAARQTDLTVCENWEKYLDAQLLEKVQDLITAAWNTNNHNGTLSKYTILTNFIQICVANGMRFFNPFNCFILCSKNHWDLLHNRF